MRANLEAKAKVRALAAKAEGDAKRLRRMAAKAAPILRSAMVAGAAQLEAAARCYYDAAWEYGRGEDAKGSKRSRDARSHEAQVRGTK